MLNPVRPALGALVTGALIGATLTLIAGHTNPGRMIVFGGGGFPDFDELDRALEHRFAKLEKRLAAETKSFGDVMDGFHAPAMHIENQADKYVLTVNMELGDMTVEDLHVNIEGQMLMISGTHVVKTDHSYSSSSFSQGLGMIPRDIDSDHASYEYDEDKKVLVVTLPKLGKEHLEKKSIPRTWKRADEADPITGLFHKKEERRA